MNENYKTFYKNIAEAQSVLELIGGVRDDILQSDFLIKKDPTVLVERSLKLFEETLADGVKTLSVEEKLLGDAKTEHFTKFLLALKDGNLDEAKSINGYYANEITKKASSMLHRAEEVGLISSIDKMNLTSLIKPGEPLKLFFADISKRNLLEGRGKEIEELKNAIASLRKDNYLLRRLDTVVDGLLSLKHDCELKIKQCSPEQKQELEKSFSIDNNRVIVKGMSGLDAISKEGKIILPNPAEKDFTHTTKINL